MSGPLLLPKFLAYSIATIPFVAALSLLFDPSYSLYTDVGYLNGALILLSIYIFSNAIHEFGHYFAMKNYDIDVVRVNIDMLLFTFVYMPGKGIKLSSPFGEDSGSYCGQTRQSFENIHLEELIWISAWGPIASTLGAIFFLILYTIATTPMWTMIFSIGFIMNYAFFVYNVMPFSGSDGGYISVSHYYLKRGVYHVKHCPEFN